VRPTGASAVGATVRLDELRIGNLLAEGGEGRVFELPLQPHLVVKCYRRPVATEFLDDMVAWPHAIGDAALAQRVRAATAWPAATVLGPPPPADADASPARPTGARPTAAAPALASAGGVGVLLPRAPRRFALRHRDGTTRLATLSYLTADPAHRAVAYGLTLPEPVGPPRLGLVYALARLLAAFEGAAPAIGHGDLSTKNVLWSLQRGPEVFVLDCDNCERYGPDSRPLTPAGRRRAMTPNWDDPAVPAGANPTLLSDRYSLALIFLRVVGAANFPMQARQRQGGAITVDFAMPAGRFGEALLGPGAPLWALCERGLSMTDPPGRPSAAEWVAALEAVLDTLGASEVMRSVWAAQGGGVPAPTPGPAHPSPALVLARPSPAGDVVIRPVLASPRPAPRWTLVPPPAPVAPWRWAQRPASGVVSTGLSAGVSPPAPAAGTPVAAQGWAYAVQAVAWWAAFHRHTARALWAPGHRADGVRHLGLCFVVDLVAAVVGLFVVAMIVSPVLGI
jgi:hypothetical protein